MWPERFDLSLSRCWHRLCTSSTPYRLRVSWASLSRCLAYAKLSHISYIQSKVLCVCGLSNSFQLNNNNIIIIIVVVKFEETAYMAHTSNRQPSSRPQSPRFISHLSIVFCSQVRWLFDVILCLVRSLRDEILKFNFKRSFCCLYVFYFYFFCSSSYPSSPLLVS